MQNISAGGRDQKKDCEIHVNIQQPQSTHPHCQGDHHNHDKENIF